MAILSLIPFVKLMSKIKMAASSRSDIPSEARIPFYMYVDEFQNFATASFIEMLSEARKYALSLIIAHQNLAQLPKDLQGSILTNCGIQVYFSLNRLILSLALTKKNIWPFLMTAFLAEDFF